MSNPTAPWLRNISEAINSGKVNFPSTNYQGPPLDPTINNKQFEEFKKTNSLMTSEKCVNEFLQAWVGAKIPVTEGQSMPKQLACFAEILDKERNIKDILEIGFNAGLSAGTFLSCRSNIKVTSVDVGQHEYVLQAQKLVQKCFPERLTLIIGDSRDVLPQLIRKKEKYDLIFIDGGHDGDIPFNDLNNALQLCKPGTLILIDDYHLNIKEYQPDVRAAVQEFIKAGHLVQIAHFFAENREMGVFKRLHQLEA